jgi:hypothetical protein
LNFHINLARNEYIEVYNNQLKGAKTGFPEWLGSVSSENIFQSAVLVDGKKAIPSLKFRVNSWFTDAL